MSKSKTAVERLDLLLAGLEDEVLRSEPERDMPPEQLATMRSEIEARIRAHFDRAAGDPEWGTGVPAPSARSMMARAMARLGSWSGAAPRVRMAFSGARPEKAGKSRTSDPTRGDGVADDEGR